MRIEQIDAYVVKLPRPNIAENIPDYVRPRKSLSYDTTPPIDDMAAARYAEALFVKITADNGLVGWGEGQSLLVPEATKAVVDRLFAPILIGENPLAREKLYDMTYGTMRGRGYRSGYLAAALAGINNALWDLSGKALDVPCYVLCPTSREQASRAASASPTSPKPSTSHSPLQLAQATSFLPLRNFSYRQAFSTLSSWNTSTRASS